MEEIFLFFSQMLNLPCLLHVHFLVNLRSESMFVSKPNIVVMCTIISEISLDQFVSILMFCLFVDTM
jgi:hypothetical protein